MTNIDGDTRSFDDHGVIAMTEEFEAEIATLRADLEAVAVAMDTLRDAMENPTPSGARLTQAYDGILKALASDGVQAVLEGKKDGE